MILCDTNVLIALLDSREPLRKRAREDLNQFVRPGLLVTEAVLSETCHLLPFAAQRMRLQDFLDEFDVGSAPFPATASLFREVFAWLARYAEHSPDWADAHLAVLCGYNRRLRVWTYDREFQSIWRRPDGSRIPVVGTQDH